MNDANDAGTAALLAKVKADKIKIDPGIMIRAEMRTEKYLLNSAKIQLQQACAMFSKRALQVCAPCG